jgi:hypothetical protein
VLKQFGQMLDQFDAALTLGNDGRTVHKGATLELRAVATMIRQIVRVMDAQRTGRAGGGGRRDSGWRRGAAGCVTRVRATRSRDE